MPNRSVQLDVDSDTTMSTYDRDYTRSFYDAYGALEWSRLEASAYGRLQAIIHTDFIQRYVDESDRVLDAGSGPGRFTIAAAGLGATVTALDVSERQLQIAKEKTGEAGLLERVDGFVRADITDLSIFSSESFDVVVCYGGALSYVCEYRQTAAAELVRVVRPGGTILISVMSLFGFAANLVRIPIMQALRDPDKEEVWRIFEDGDRLGFPSPRVNMQHPPMHLYSSDELRKLIPESKVLELAGSNVTAFEGSTTIDEVFEDHQAWSTAVQLEKRLNHMPGLVDNGSHIIMAAERLRRPG